MAGAEEWVWKNGLTPKWNDETGQYYVEKKIGKATYKLWSENNKSIETKLSAVKAAGIENYAFWSVGQEQGFVWHTVGEYAKLS